MRIKLAVVTGAAVVLTAGTGAAAYAVVGHGSVNPTVSGNDLPIDDNHSPAPASRTAEPGDDSRTVVPAAGTEAEPGDDHGGGHRGGSDDGAGHR